MRRPGLRTRVTAGFAAGALILSASMALLSYELTRRYLLPGRERTAERAAFFDAKVVQAGLSTEDPDLINVLRTLDTGESRRAVLLRGGKWYSRAVDSGITQSIPTSLRQLVATGRPGIQRVRTGGQTVVVIGVPLSETTALYEVDSLSELEHTLSTLGLVLTFVALSTTAGGAGLGWYATRHVLRPLRSVAAAAQEIAAGDFNARLDPAPDPELRRLAWSFNHMVDQLAARMERDRRFAADVSHELRSPLQTLAASASVLTRRKAELDPRTATAATLVAEEVGRFQVLVTDLLELARGDQPPDRTPVNVADLARTVCKALGVPPEVVVVDGDPDGGVTWRVDRRRVEQVLSNLIDNANRHGGGPVAVRLGRASGLNYIEVDDEGPGVRPEDREAIFDRFVRARSTTARGDSHGTGLGLALVAQHVAAHGGEVRVVDRPGGGARFRVELPEDAP